MNENFLQTITSKTRERIAAVRSEKYADALRRRAEKRVDRYSLSDAMRAKDGVNIIAEIKRASPSKGTIKTVVDVAAHARRYAAGGASAISVLTEGEFFGGSIGDLINARSAVELPVLRKDFIVDEFQVLEAAAAGADAILLIVAALSDDEIARLIEVCDRLGIEPLVEVHNSSQLDRAVALGCSLIGVNNRDLDTLEVSLDTSRQLISRKPADAIMIAESGISSRTEIDELRGLGFDGFLIGEALMRSSDPVALLGDLGA